MSTLKPVWSTHILCMCCVQFFIPSRLHSSFIACVITVKVGVALLLCIWEVPGSYLS